jgi:hypothetical protein
MATREIPLASRAAPGVGPGASALHEAVVATLAYADVFDHPLTAAEVHRDLVAVRASPAQVRRALSGIPGLSCRDGYYALPGRQATVAIRLQRAAAAAGLWSRALRWGRALAALPLVRMVAITGALAVDSVDPGADIDYLVVAAAGRVWVCRALVTALARLVSLRGAALCPNYLISEDALVIALHNLYTAHELVQMVPVAGPATFLRMLEANRWIGELLPNAGALPTARVEPGPVGGALARLVEAALHGRLGDALEARLQRWQSARLRRKIDAGRLGGHEASFGADGYKGHFDAHGERIMAAWEARVLELRWTLT